MQSPPPLCKYFSWIDHEVPKDIQKDQLEVVLGASGCPKKGFKEAWRKSVVRKRGWSGSNARRGHAKRSLLVRRRGQESLQKLARHKRRMRHVTRRGNGPVWLSKAFASVDSSCNRMKPCQIYHELCSTKARSHVSWTCREWICHLFCPFYRMLEWYTTSIHFYQILEWSSRKHIHNSTQHSSLHPRITHVETN